MYVQFNGKLYAPERVNIDPGANCAPTEEWWADVIGLPYTFPADGVNLLGVSGTTLAGVSSDVDIILGHGRSRPRDAPPLQGSDACAVTTKIFIIRTTPSTRGKIGFILGNNVLQPIGAGLEVSSAEGGPRFFYRPDFSFTAQPPHIRNRQVYLEVTTDPYQ
jgi:hypothetical protein